MAYPRHPFFTRAVLFTSEKLSSEKSRGLYGLSITSMLVTLPILFPLKLRNVLPQYHMLSFPLSYLNLL